MGFDVVGAINSIWQSQYGVLVILSVSLLLVLWGSGFFNRLFRIIEEMMFNNWQLALLGATAIALSLASGYTTFDGLRNFTSAPLLSILIAFGIQGVMLIVAWLIGESFATGMNQPAPRGAASARAKPPSACCWASRSPVSSFYWMLTQYNAVGFTEPPASTPTGPASPTSRSISSWRWCWSPSSPSTSGAAATSRCPTCRACA